ncbi:MAG TPA: pyridoxal phosphate-dependent aminotransferase [bacterium]
MTLAKRVSQVQPSQTLAITALVDTLRREGRSIIDLGAGEPDFDTPQVAKDAAVAAIAEGYTKYTPATGSVEIRKAICEKLKRENALNYSPAEIVVTCGAKHAIINVLLALCQEGDEVIVQSPYWTSYVEQVRFVGARPVIVETDERSGFKMSIGQLQGAITAKTKMLILNSPSNPTGAVYTRQELAAIADLVRKFDFYILSDEIYEKIIYDGLRHESIAVFPEMRERTIVVNGVSKSYAMTGWRIGYLAAAAEITGAVTTIQSHTTSNPTSISQRAAIAALNANHTIIDDMVVEFKERRDYLASQLREMPGIVCPLPEGAFYMFPSVDALFGKKYRQKPIQSSMDLCAFLLEQEGIAAVPGEAFGSPRHIRISYATSMANLKEAVARLGRAFKALSDIN